MQEIRMDKANPEFLECWRVAVRHIQDCADPGSLSWLKVRPEPPFLEHLSFRIGNQAFFVRLEDWDGQVDLPGTAKGLYMVADGCRGHACLMMLKHTASGWRVENSGWGLVDARSMRPVDPPSLVTDAPVEMTDWELLDFAVQVVRTYLEEEGRQIMSSHANPAIDPSLWFVGPDGPEWVVVRAVRYPEIEASPPANMRRIAAGCQHLGVRGHFASVGVSHFENAPGALEKPPRPVLRGDGLGVWYLGLETVWAKACN